MKLATRDKILNAIKLAKPALEPLPTAWHLDAIQYDDAAEKFIETFSAIGGQVILVNTIEDIKTFIAGNFSSANMITTVPALTNVQQLNKTTTAHELENIELAVVAAQFGVAENGAVWMTENDMQVRVLPFICQQLAVIMNRKNILNNMHEAYDRIAATEYDFAAFIAGPSKTADIEQSLVLGAHGPKSMIIFLLDN